MIGLPGPADAQWKWRDQSGQVNVSDRPPPKDVPEKDILARPTPQGRTAVEVPAAAASAASSPSRPEVGAPVDRELEARKKAAEQEQAARAKAEADRLAENRAENCRRARAQAGALESGQRMARINDKGEREVLDDKARAEELSRARAIVASDCR
jgi:hypothetical protein